MTRRSHTSAMNTSAAASRGGVLVAPSTRS